MTAKLFCFGVLAAMFAGVASASSVFNVKDYGAIGDGVRLDTVAINETIDQCAASGGGMVLLPAGKYLSGTINLKSHIALCIDSGATLLASQKEEDYPLVPNTWAPDRQILSPLIYATDAENVTITGRGTIDGQGQPWWAPILAAKARGRSATADASGATSRPTTDPTVLTAQAGLPHGRPALIRLIRCKDVVIEHLNLLNSPSWHIHPLMCENLRVDGISIRATVPSPNTDGINPESCRNVQIINCRIDTGDDCVTLKSGTNEIGRSVGKPDEDITISNCVMYQGHGGVTIGSEMSGGVRNVVVTNCVFKGTQNGIRIKSQRGRGGIVEGVAVSNIVMQDVPHPFTITTFYMGRDTPDEQYPVDERTPRFRDFVFSNITARGATEAGSVTGLREMPVQNLSFNNVHIQADHGFTCINAGSISFKDVVIDTPAGPAMTLRNCTNIDTARLSTQMPHDGTPLVQTSSTQPTQQK